MTRAEKLKIIATAIVWTLFAIGAVWLMAGCDAPAAPVVRAAPVPKPTPTPGQRQLYACRKLCESQGLAIARASTGEHPICECGQPALGTDLDVVDGVAIGVGVEVGRSVGRAVLRELF